MASSGLVLGLSAQMINDSSHKVFCSVMRQLMNKKGLSFVIDRGSISLSYRDKVGESSKESSGDIVGDTRVPS